MLDSPFLYLSACSIKNRVLSRLRRLREPRYLIGVLVGAAYLYLVFFRGRVRVRAVPSEDRAMRLPADLVAGLQLAGAFFLWLIVAARWLLPVSTQPLQLSGGERDLLLAAPVTRRRITRYKLLRSQLGVLLSTVLMLVVAWTSVRSRLSFLLGMFLLLTTLRMHLLGVALNRVALVRGARRPDVAAIAAAAVVGFATVGALLALAPGIAVAARSQDLEAALPLVREGASRPLVAAALLPFALLVRPLFAAWPGPFAAACWPAVVLALLNYAWVVRSEDVAGQAEAATEQQTAEGKRAPARAVYRRPPFELAPDGRPELALVWKNLIMLGRYASPRTLLRVGLPIVSFAVVLAAGRHWRLASAAFPIAAAISCGLTLLGPYSFRNDLRQDLASLSVLKTWPISGERLLWGEVLAPTAAVTAVVWVCLVLTAILALAAPPAGMQWTAWIALTFSALVVFPAVILAQVVVQNAAVVLFPAWVATGPSRPRGVEAMGQQMLMFAGSALLLVLGLVPGGLLGAAVTFLGFFVIGWLALIPGALVASALLAGEIVVAVHLLGGVLDRTDPTAVDAT